MKVLIFGATGFVGKKLQTLLTQKGHTVVPTDQRRDRDWPSKVASCDAVVNLAGTPIFGKRWNDRIKSQIFDTRVHGTERIFEEMKALMEGDQKKALPKVYVSASAIGFYSSRGDDVLTETSEGGTDFLAFTCRNWEEQAQKMQGSLGVRTVLLRFGIILGKDGGALEKMLPPFKLGIGGRIGNGRQWMSWIHLDDICEMIAWALENSEARGTYNAVSPQPVTNSEFTKVLGKTLSRPTIFPIPKIGMYVLFGEAASILVGSQRVVPQKLEKEGFKFKFSTLDTALENILKT